jgi:putative DNA primase/helicase
LTSEVAPVGFSDEQIAALDKRAIPADAAAAFGVIAVQTDGEMPAGLPDYWTSENGYVPGLLFPYRSSDGETTTFQLRPDTPVVYRGETKKYVFEKDAPSILNAARVGEPDAPVLIVEGTCQTIAASLYAPIGVSVYGIAGAQSWMKKGVPTRDLAVVDGRDVFIVLDADAATNLNVYTAGVQLREACIAQGAESVRFVRIPGTKSTGLDDVLASEAPERRTKYLTRLIELTRNRPKSEKPELPAVTKPKAKKAGDDGDGSPFFDGEKLKVQTLAEHVVGQQPAALTREDKVALYIDGVYRIDGKGFLSTVTHLLGEDFRVGHLTNAEAFAVGRLAAAGQYLADHHDEPLMNVRNGMVDLRTGALLDHDPKYRSSVQFPIDYDPAATAPVYEQWAKEQIGEQLDDLEESVALMLDPSQTPTKAVFLFGPSRSGKSTYLRLLIEIAGPDNTSAVTLHQLAEDRFAAANVYGRALNVAADLKAAHIDDISMFKLMTGEDLIQANRKYGAQFAFTNRALFAFSANELPTVGESSRAYSERIKPFNFPNSFAGREDQTLETRLRAELPGILNRWIAAWQRRTERGAPLPTNDRVRDLFEEASDRVRAFVAQCCEIVPVEKGQGGTTGGTESTTTELYQAFRNWTDDEGRTPMAKSKVRDRLRTVPGVVETVSAGKSRGWNLRLRKRGEWGSTSSPQAGMGESKADDLTGDGATDGTLPVSDHPTPVGNGVVPMESDVAVTNDGEKSMTTGVGRVGQNGQSSTAVLDMLTALAVPPVADDCPDCDRPRELVPPAMFWRACRHCTPDTFGRA